MFNLCFGGCAIYSGMDTVKPLDVDHCDIINTMPYPSFTISDDPNPSHVMETKNGVKVEFLELGKKARITYKSKDGKTSFDVLQEAATPLLVRGHVFPSEAEATDPSQAPGGSEQYMTCTGSLTLNGVKHEVDCVSIRDRSWRQVRTEDEVPYPPVGWSPIYFGPHLSFNQVGYDSTQVWDEAFEVDKKKPCHYFAWVLVDGVQREVKKVRRNIIKWHPQLYSATEQTIEAEDDQGATYKFHGVAVAQAHLPSWPNSIFIDSVYKWTNEKTGEVAYCTYQEAWFARYQRFMKDKISGEGYFVGDGGLCDAIE